MWVTLSPGVTIDRRIIEFLRGLIIFWPTPSGVILSPLALLATAKWPNLTIVLFA